jgi:transposase
MKKQVEFSNKKAVILDIMIDLAQKEHNIPIRKTPSSSDQSISSKNKKA